LKNGKKDNNIGSCPGDTELKKKHGTYLLMLKTIRLLKISH